TTRSFRPSPTSICRCIDSSSVATTSPNCSLSAPAMPRRPWPPQAPLTLRYRLRRWHVPTGDHGRHSAVEQRRPAGVIHDIGYQRYSGLRLGRRYATRSLYVHGVRTAFGLGRGAKSKIFPWFSAAVLLLFAVVDVAVRARTGTLPISYLDLTRNGALLVI